MRAGRVAIISVAVGLAFAAIAFFGRSDEETATTATTVTTSLPSTTTSTTLAPVVQFTAADAVTDRVPVFAAPTDAEPVIVLTNPTPEDVPLTLLVKEIGPPGWLMVQYNRRPNGATGFIPASTVTLRPVDNRIVISVASKTLTVYKGVTDQVVFQAPVATGVPRTPTPLGDFYVDVVVKLTRTTGPYGPYQLSVAGFSDVLQSFAGGAGQIAIHGTNQPWLIGQEASNGCVRMNNDDITALQELVRAGTPVTIVA